MKTKLIFLLAVIALGVSAFSYFKYQDLAKSNSIKLADGAIIADNLSPELQKQLDAVTMLAGALPSDSSTFDGCQDGQLLSFSDGKLACATTNSDGTITVDEVSDASGEAGTSGTTGADGTQGSSDDLGPQGEQGVKGDIGATGAKGVAGDDGDSGVLSTTLGDGLSGSLASQVLTLNIVTNTNGGLTTDSNGVSLITSCASGEVLKFNSSVWSCDNDDVGSVSSGNLTSATSGITVTGGTGAVLGGGTSISVATATSGQNGLLSSTDWSTFDNKEDALTFDGNGLFSRTGNSVSGTTCSSSQILVFDGTDWQCGADTDTDTTYTAGAGLALSGTVFTLDPSTLSSVSGVSGTDEFVLQTGSGTRKITYNDLFGGILGSLNYQGSWDATANTPDLSAACNSGTKGEYYVVETAGSTALDGVSTWNIGDWVVCNGTDFDRIQATNQVNTVFGRTGVITAENGDYNASQVTNAPSGNVSGTTVQAAIDELESEKISTSLASGKLLLGNGSNLATAVTMSGDATLSNTGALTIANDAVTSAKILNGTIQFADIASNGCSTDEVVKYDGSAWTCGTPATNLTIGTLDAGAGSADGATLASGVLYLQSASETLPGLVTTGAQTFAGSKTFSGAGITTTDVMKIVADALTSGNGLEVTSNATAFTGNLAKFGLTGSNSANTGTVVSISGGTNANVLPLSIVSGGNQIASHTNGAGATTGYYTGSGSPEGIVTANVGSRYSATDTGSLYSKTTGTGNTGWAILSQGVGASYMQAGISSAQNSQNENNDHFIFDAVTNSTGSDIQLDTTSSYSSSQNTASSGRFTLEEGKTYEMTVHFGQISVGGQGGMSFGWYNSDTGTVLGANLRAVPVSGSNYIGGTSSTVIYTAPVDTRVEFRIFDDGSGISSIAGETFGAPQTNAIIRVVGGNAPVVGQTVEFLNVQRSGTNQVFTSQVSSNPQNIIFNEKLSGNIPFDTATGIASLSAGKTYNIRSTINMSANSSRFVQYALVNASNNAELSPRTEAATLSGGDNAPANFIDFTYTPSADIDVRIRAVGGNASTGEEIRADLYSGMTITQIGSTAATGIAMSALEDAISSNALDNAGYTQTWSWNSLGANDGLVLGSTDTTASGSLASITSATQTGNAMKVTADSLTSGNGLNVTSSATSMTGNLVSISLAGDAAGNTGTLLSLNASGTANAVAGLKINVLGDGLALDITGGVAFRPGTNYTATGTQNNVSFGPNSTYRLAPGSALTITGIADGTDGKLLTLMNTGSSSATLSNQSVSSTAANRIITGNDADLVLTSDQSALLQYDATADRWRVISTNATTAKTGSSILASPFNTTSSTYVNTGMSVTLPSAGTYVITYSVASYNDTADYQNTFRLYDGSSEVQGSMSPSQGNAAGFNMDNATKTVIVTVTAQATYQLQTKTTLGTMTIGTDVQPSLVYYSLK